MKYIALKHWARKDIYRPYGARNMYQVVRETDKAVYVIPVDVPYNIEPAAFWAPKSAIIEQ